MTSKRCWFSYSLSSKLAVPGARVLPGAPLDIKNTVGSSASRSPRRLEARAGVDAGPANAAVGRPVHDVLAGRQTTAAFVHRRLVNPGTALQVAGDLDVANEAGDELHLRPGGAVVGVDDVSRATADIIVVVRNVHPAVEGVNRVVVHPTHSRGHPCSRYGRRPRSSN